VNGLEIENGTANFNLLDGKVFSMGDRMVRDIYSKANSPQPILGPEEAIVRAAEQLNIAMQGSIQVLETMSPTEFLYDKGDFSLEHVPVKLVYHSTGEVLRLSWDLSISTTDENDWWSVRIDALTGEMIGQNNWTTHCQFENCGHPGKDLQERMEALSMSEHLASPPPPPGTYNVFAIPVESPAHGPRTFVSNAEDPIASPFGWHDTNGVPGDEFSTTRGNNVHAYEDRNSNDLVGEAPDGGGDLIFDFPYDIEQPALDNLDAATTNLFYMNNIMHDVWYQYGFDEQSGNFQEENYLNAGGAENDYVRAESQDGSGLNNANFSTPTDGTRPRMQMYLWTDGSGSSDFFVNSPPTDASLDITYENSNAAFGPGIPSIPIIADLVLVTDGSGGDEFDACEDIANGSELNGKIAVIRRGSCEFGFKVLAAEEEGAVAVIIVNNVSGDPVTMGAGDVGGLVSIPSIMLSAAQGQPIMNALEDGEIVNGTLVDGSADLVAFDSSFDNGIVAHEYGHGISIRLTGGANNSNCLANDEQMGEGWSDWFGIMLTMVEGDQPEDPRGVGTYVIDQPNSGTGIRPAPYSTSPSVNNFTYSATNNTNSISLPHGIGFVWASMLWDMNWALIEEYGYDADFYNGTGGNNIAMQLVIDGLKLQSCSPGFVDGRDAILEADLLNYGGANHCLIWDVFANRGLGFSADQGSSFSRTDQVQAFDLPPFEVTIENELGTLVAQTDNPGVSYQWINCTSNTPITGATESSFTPMDNGEYAVIISQYNCESTSNCIDMSSVGIEELDADDITLSPNPARDILTIDFKTLDNIQSLELMDVRGKVVYQEVNVSEQLMQLEVNDFVSGLYTLRVTCDNAIGTYKVVIE
ncbi:MAG: T9SS type A sorting domain-containing protein, partial [Flavobacteriales bacterium]|nr:T9SS type A sorting domain-containing protein [Flavobacteriales bacterium]